MNNTALNYSIAPNPLILGGLNNIEKLYQQGLYYLAEEKAMKLLELNPFEDRVLFTLAMIKYKSNEIEVSKFLLEKAIVQRPDELYIHNLAAIYNDEGDYNKALELSIRALAIDPTHLLSLKNIASIYFKQNDLRKALDYYKKIIELYLKDDEAKAFVSIIQDNEKITNLPTDYITKLFDDYAGNFDHHLNNILGYKIPQMMVELLQKYCNFLKDSQTKILDLGCGTGLFAENLVKQFQQQTFNITGVDLSSNMIEIARHRNIYKKLIINEITHFLAHTHKKYNLISAADVISYFGDIDQLFTLVSNSMEREGIFIFSAESNENDKNFELIINNMRFKHNIDYLTSLITKSGLKIIEQKEESIRENNQQNVKGIIFLTQKI